MAAMSASRKLFERLAGPWTVLGQRDYALLFWGQLISATGTQMQVVAVAWQVYALTHSPLALGVIGLLQALPRLLFSLPSGVLADVLDRRRLLIVVSATMMALSGVLALCTGLKGISVGIIYVVVFLGASVSAFDFPTRQAVIPALVPREHLVNALAFSSLMTQVTFIVGPTAGGFAIAWLGLANTYWLDVASYLAAIGTLCLLVVPRVPLERRARPGAGALVEGLRFLHTRRLILVVLILDLCANFFGEPSALLPFYARDILHSGSQGLGLLLAAPSVGAVALAPVIGLFGRMKRRGLGVTLAPMVWGLCIAAFGLFPDPFWPGLLLLAGAGAADMVSIYLRSLIIQTNTPDEFRGRVSSVVALCSLGGPLLGQFESGLVAGLFSPMISLVSGGLACALVALLIVAIVPGLLHLRARE